MINTLALAVMLEICLPLSHCLSLSFFAMSVSASLSFRTYCFFHTGCLFRTHVCSLSHSNVTCISDLLDASGRHFKTIGEPTPLLKELTQRLAVAFGFENLSLSPTLCRTVSVITQCGAIQPHWDAYPLGGGLAGCGHVRANIVVQVNISL